MEIVYCLTFKNQIKCMQMMLIVVDERKYLNSFHYHFKLYDLYDSIIRMNLTIKDKIIFLILTSRSIENMFNRFKNKAE